MDYKIFKKYLALTDGQLSTKINLICKKEEITSFWDVCSKSIEDDFRQLISLSRPSEYRGIFDGDLLMFADGFVKFLYSSYSSLTFNDESSIFDVKFNNHSAIVSQIFNGLNHISHLVVMDEVEQGESIQKNLIKFVELNRTSDNDQYCDILLNYVNSFGFLSIQAVRNHLTHQLVFPLEYYGIHFVIVDFVRIALQIIYYLKLALDGDEWINLDDIEEFRNETKEFLKKLNENEEMNNEELKRVIKEFEASKQSVDELLGL